VSTAETTANLEHVECNLCGSTIADTVYEAKYAESSERDLVRIFRASGDELLVDRLMRCRECGLEYVSPRPRAADIVEAYSMGDDPAYVSQMQARERTFNAALANIESLLPGRGRLLDIGTAAGGFLAAARDRGWQVEGCDPNKWMAEWGSRHYGLPIRTGEIFDQDFAPASFDVVTLWDVIEHTPDPSRVIGRAAVLLKPGGLLVINYPDRGTWLARLLGRKWPFLSSVHLYYFTRQTISRLLQKEAFEIVEMRPHIQRLEVDYLLSRGSVVSQFLASTLRRVARVLRVSTRHAPYWIGQTFVAARRTPPRLQALLAYLMVDSLVTMLVESIDVLLA
jgi:2-polyprenyl-3-methyl-5-hydroxy-6-metoxy-1,4-benzoquinol methylase